MISLVLGKTFWMVGYLLFTALNSGFQVFYQNQSSEHDGLSVLAEDALFMFSQRLCARIGDGYFSSSSSSSFSPSPVSGSLSDGGHSQSFSLELLLSHRLSPYSLSLHPLISPWSSVWQFHPQFKPKHLTCYVLQVYSFLILSILVIKEKLTCFISTTSTSASRLLLCATVSEADLVTAAIILFLSFHSCWCSSITERT